MITYRQYEVINKNRNFDWWRLANLKGFKGGK